MATKREAQTAAAELREMLAGDNIYLGHVETLERYAGELRRDKSEQTDKIADLEGKLAGCQQQLQVARQQVVSLQAELQTTKTALQTTQTECEQHKADAALWRAEKVGNEAVNGLEIAPTVLRWLYRKYSLPQPPQGWCSQTHLENLNLVQSPAEVDRLPKRTIQDRKEQLTRLIEEYEMDYASTVRQRGRETNPLLILPHDSIGTGYAADEYTMAGMMLKFASLHGVTIEVPGNLTVENMPEFAELRHIYATEMQLATEEYVDKPGDVLSPSWEARYSQRDWRSYVPPLLRKCWPTMITESRVSVWYVLHMLHNVFMDVFKKMEEKAAASPDTEAAMQELIGFLEAGVRSEPTKKNGVLPDVKS